MNDTSVETPWYALRVKSNFERTSATMLDARGIETYLPMYRELRKWSDRNKLTEVPLFPGYVFARFDSSRKLPVVTTPGVVHIVPPHGAPAAVDPCELDAIRRAIASGEQVGPFPFLQIGQRVVIERGSMTGLEGILIESKRDFRLVISVTLLQRSVAVAIDRDWVRPIGPLAKAARVG
ncbi:MAG: transcription termination/antitermination protein NusG [Acidobacteriota bacterium]